jgi:hypothetical protein
MGITSYSDDTVDLPVISQRLFHFQEEMWLDALAAGKQIAEEMQAYAKEHHPWKNRTGDTELTTEATADMDDEGVFITLTAGTSYAIFLETLQNGKWSWLWPAAQNMAPRILEIWQEHIER